VQRVKKVQSRRFQEIRDDDRRSRCVGRARSAIGGRTMTTTEIVELLESGKEVVMTPAEWAEQKERFNIMAKLNLRVPSWTIAANLDGMITIRRSL
jgi:hypothetical protein